MKIQHVRNKLIIGLTHCVTLKPLLFKEFFKKRMIIIVNGSLAVINNWTLILAIRAQYNKIIIPIQLRILTNG